MFFKILTNNYGLFPNGNAQATAAFLGLPGNDETITIGSRTYTFKSVLTVPSVPNEVLIGLTADECGRNLTQAMVVDPNGESTNYSTGTVVHPTVTAFRDLNNSPEMISFYAIQGGAGGNSIGISTTSASIDLGGAINLTGGADSSNIGMIITGGISPNTFQTEWNTLIPPNLMTASFAIELLIEQLGHSLPSATRFVLALAYGYEENETEFWRTELGDFDSSVTSTMYFFPDRIDVPLKNIPGNSRIACKITSNMGGNPTVIISVQLKPNSA